MTDPTLASASLAALQARCDDAVAAVEDAKRCLVKTNDIWQAREAAFTSLNAAQLDVRELKHDLQPHIDREQALQRAYDQLSEATTPNWRKYDHAAILSLARCNKQDADMMDDADGNPERAWEAKVESLQQEVEALRAWQAHEQTGLLSMAVALLGTGYTGTGILDGITFLKEQLADTRRDNETLRQEIARLRSALDTENAEVLCASCYADLVRRRAARQETGK